MGMTLLCVAFHFVFALLIAHNVIAKYSTMDIPCGTLGCSAQLDYVASEEVQTMWLRLRVTVPPGDRLPGWLAMGFSPNGAMSHGDYIYGYQGCVRALSNRHDGLPPGSPEPFALTEHSFTVEGRNMTLEAVRPFKTSLHEHVELQKGILTNVLYAAGSTNTAPKDGECNAWLTMLNHHDFGDVGLAGHVIVDLFAQPEPAPSLTTSGSIKLGCCGSLTWQVIGDTVALHAEAVVEKNNRPGWLGIGFSPGGTMAAGDYIFGYPGCVRALSSTKEGVSPGSEGTPAPFNLTNTSFTISGQTMILDATRPLGTSVLGHVNLGTEVINILYAGGSQWAEPWSCDSSLSLLNHHNLGYLVGNTKAGIWSGAPAPPPTPQPPGDKWQCTVCAHVYDPTQDAVSGCADAKPSCKAAAGTAFLDLPASWVCPVCGQPKTAYRQKVNRSAGEEYWLHERSLVV